jgi:nitrogen fixation NifU-like protein
MSELRDLYQEVILDHYKRPRNFSLLPEANREAKGHNPLCGDMVTIYLVIAADRIQDIKFQGAGCAISTASASLMTDALKGKTLAEAEALFGQFHELLTAETCPPTAPLGKLAVLAGVREYPMRVKCATLAWHTFHAALQDQAIISTE